MLVLSRHPNQSIRIGEDITITIVAVNGDKVKIGFDIPKDIKVWRTELLAKIKENQDGNISPIND